VNNFKSMADSKHTINEMKKRVREMSEAQREKRSIEIAKEITDSRMKLMTGSLKNVHQMKTLRKELAFIKFLQSERMSEASKPQTEQSEK